MYTLDKRSDNGLDVKIHASMLNRHEIMTFDSMAANGTGVSVQELINMVCGLINDPAFGIANADAYRMAAIVEAIEPLWTRPDGSKVV